MIRSLRWTTAKLYSLAVPEFEAFLKQNPTHAKADQARSLIRLNEPQKATAFLAQSIPLH